jgi:nucleoside-diphosphate-sugar epimerase
MILVTGGAGYVGCVLVPKLLKKGYDVRVLDLYLYGVNVLEPHPKLEQVRGDIRNAELLRKCVQGCDTVIHLACISNDPSCELDPQLTKSVNYDAFVSLVEICKEEKIRRFIQASSSSVYGVSDSPNVTEDHERVPVSEYNRYKALCEDYLNANGKGLSYVIIRPATVCGYSPRLRLDLTVNILTNLAFNKRQITVFGGSQYRPNLHIEDMTDLYIRLIEEPDERIAGKTFNAGYQNQTVAEIANIVKKMIEEKFPEKGPIEIITTKSDDIRSYRISTEKIAKELQFVPKYTIEDAVIGLCEAFQAGKIPDSLTDTRYYNVKTMKEIGLD